MGFTTDVMFIIGAYFELYEYFENGFDDIIEQNIEGEFMKWEANLESLPIGVWSPGNHYMGERRCYFGIGVMKDDPRFSWMIENAVAIRELVQKAVTSKYGDNLKVEFYLEKELS